VIYAQGQGSSTPVLEAINASTGAVLWSTTTGSDGYFLQGTLAAAKGLVYAGCGLHIDGNPGGICAYDQSNGAQKWAYIPDCKCSPNNYVAGPLAYADGAVYFGDGGFVSQSDPYVAALSARGGMATWGYDPGVGGGALAVGGGLVYFSCDRSGNFLGVCALEQSSGTFVWSYATGDPNTAMTFEKGVVYASFSNGFIVGITALKASTGAPLWTFNYTGSINPTKPAAIAKGRIFLTGTDGNLYALHAATGKLIWSDNLSGSCSGQSSPSVANGVLYVDQSGPNCPEVSAFATSNGRLLWSNPTPGSTIFPPPMISSGVLYLTNASCGSVCAYGLPGSARRLYVRPVR
jgi:outer membrane protein assembly factor BamB